MNSCLSVLSLWQIGGLSKVYEVYPGMTAGIEFSRYNPEMDKWKKMDEWIRKKHKGLRYNSKIQGKSKTFCISIH